ncbi:MAG: four helix bundle protein [Chitinophagaceae bacterium]
MSYLIFNIFMTSKELESRLKSFAYRAVKVCEAFPQKKLCRIIEDQFLRSAFSAAANYRAACRAISKKSFISKLSIAFEEIDESLFWLEVVNDLQLIKTHQLAGVISEANELCSILASARKTSQKNQSLKP